MWMLVFLLMQNVSFYFYSIIVDVLWLFNGKMRQITWVEITGSMANMKISCNFWQKAKKKQFWERWPIQHISANSAINCAIVKSQNSRSPCHNPQNMCRAWWNGCGGRLLWQPYGIGPALIFLPSDFYLLLLSFFLSSPNLRLDVCHTSTHGVALVRI